MDLIFIAKTLQVEAFRCRSDDDDGSVYLKLLLPQGMKFSCVLGMRKVKRLLEMSFLVVSLICLMCVELAGGNSRRLAVDFERTIKTVIMGFQKVGDS